MSVAVETSVPQATAKCLVCASWRIPTNTVENVESRARAHVMRYGHVVRVKVHILRVFKPAFERVGTA